MSPQPLLRYTPGHLAEKILTSKTVLEGERKQVPVLFADLKDSNELLADRDPEKARQLLDPVLEHMMGAVHEYEGIVNQVMDDGIMALFGASIAHEDHAVRACYAALAMQAALDMGFGDFYVAWDIAGLHLATIAMDYYDPDLLAYDGEFPFEGAFRIDWGVDAGAGPRRFALYVIPAKLSTDRINAAMRGVLCRLHGGSREQIPSAVATYFGSKQPRITVEASLPWQALGVDGPPRGSMRMMLVATGWHRSRRIS